MANNPSRKIQCASDLEATYLSAIIRKRHAVCTYPSGYDGEYWVCVICNKAQFETILANLENLRNDPELGKFVKYSKTESEKSCDAYIDALISSNFFSVPN